MEGCVDLKLIGSEESQNRLMQSITASLPNSWRRCLDLEREDRTFSKHHSLWFEWLDSEYGANVAIKFGKDSNRYYYVSTVRLMKASRALTPSEENSVIHAFYRTFLEGRADSFDIRVNMTSPDASPEKVMSPELLEKFRIWEARDFGTHSLDVAAKYAFIIQAHEEKSLVSSNWLKAYLSKGIPDEKLDDLIIKEHTDIAISYEEGRNLLEQYDKWRD